MAKKKKAQGDARGYQQGGGGIPQQQQQQQAQRVVVTKKASSSRMPAAADDAPKVVPVTASTHQDLEQLLETLLRLNSSTDDNNVSSSANGDKQSTTATTAIPSDRFFKRMSTIYDRLTEYGFTLDQMKQAVGALGYDITVELALDWLCLHLSTQELPPLFTEGLIREFNTNNNNNVTDKYNPQVVVAAPISSDASSLQEDLVLSMETTTLKEKESAQLRLLQRQQLLQQQEQDEREKEAQKAWLLQQYEYVQEDDDAGDAVDEKKNDKVAADNGIDSTMKEPEVVPSIRLQQPVALEPIQPSSSSPEPTPTLEELRLQALNEELGQCEADVKDEASNYMRSKLEIKELQKRTKNLRKQVQGLQLKVDKQKRQKEKEDQESSSLPLSLAAAEVTTRDYVSAAAAAQFEPKDGGGEAGDELGGMFSMFDEEDQGQTATSTTQNASQDDHVDENALIIPEDSIPKKWTGKTPREILQDWCRKEKLKRPIYQKLPRNGCSVRVNLGPSRAVYLQEKGPHPSYADTQEYMATKALYEITPELPLYRVLPPFHSDIWRAWMDHGKQEKDSKQQEGKDRRKEDIEMLVGSVPGVSQTLSAANKSIKTKMKTTKTRGAASEESWDGQPMVEESWEDQDDTRALESWEDQDDAGQPPIFVKDAVRSTPADERLRTSFRKRQLSANYKEMMQLRSSLPMYSYREEILDTIRANPVTIIFAETGAGKTTQCPQFILEQALLEGKGSRVSILCTQPRRVAAMSVAERVSDEMCEESIGKLVGYQIRLEARRSSATKLLFCTTGVILRRLVEDPSLSGISHVMVDEVHERQWQIDVLLVALRGLVNGARPDLKVILMSATLDAELFKTFFNGAPLVTVPGRTFPVATYFLEDLLDATDHIIEEGSRNARRQPNERETAALWVSTRGGEKRRETVSLDSELSTDVSDDFAGYKMSTRRSMERVDETSINYDLIEDVLGIVLVKFDKNCGLVPPENSDLSDGSVLIFLPGIGEIRTLTERLAGSRIFGKEQFDIVPMHSTLSSTDQRKAFQPARKGCRKIIISTNIAETSVTIPDVVCVIDSGRVREVQRDKRTSTSKLVMEWCSRASGKQRAGRAGRVQPGVCLKLFSSRTEKFQMKRATEPELRRIPLEEVCLNILAAGFAKSCMDFLCQTPQPPTQDAVRSALNVLSEIGAVSILKPLDETSRVPSTEELTPLGQHLAKLPVDVRLGKMLIFGALFRCIDTVLTVAASLSASQSVFASSLYENQEARAARLAFAHPQSDFLSLCNVWDAYRKCNGPSEERKFCKAKFLNSRALKEIGDARSLYLDLLAGLGFLERKKLGYDQRKREYDEKVLSSSLYNVNGRKEEVVHAVICAGTYPNVARFVTTSGGDRSLWHKQERLFIHSSSVNAKTPTHLPSPWVAFHEKFGTSNRVSVSTTCFVHPFSLMIFGGSLVVKHTERTVCLDEWIELGIAAKTGVMFRELRKQVDLLLKAVIEGADSQTKAPERDAKATLMVEGIVQLLQNNDGVYKV